MWPALRGSEPGLTFDGQTNSAPPHHIVRDPFEQMRYDRIMMKGSSNLSPAEISMVGTEPLNQDQLKPSDHYGLHVLLETPGASAEDSSAAEHSGLSIPTKAGGNEGVFEAGNNCSFCRIG